MRSMVKSQSLLSNTIMMFLAIKFPKTFVDKDIYIYILKLFFLALSITFQKYKIIISKIETSNLAIDHMYSIISVNNIIIMCVLNIIIYCP